MTREVVFREDAAADIDGLYEHIARDSPDRAIGFIRRIRDRCRGLADFPEVGRARDDLRPGLRLLAFERRVVIAYAITPHQVEIFRVFYGGRDIEVLRDDI